MSQDIAPLNLPDLGSAESISVERLVLDENNSRLVTDDGSASDEAIIAQLYRGADLSELLLSIAANGYLDIEPLIVVEEGERIVVLEGNRRLAAIRLFREPELARKIVDSQRLRITVPDISDEHRATLDRVSVYRVAQREDARSFIGFKHINGAAKWESYAKAKFAADWYRKGETSLEDIAKQIGDRHDTIKRMVNAIYVLEQARSEGVFDIEDRVNPRFSFSHLYTALSRVPFMQFLGLDAAWASYDPKPNPVPNDRVECLSEVLRWIYGSKEDNLDPVIRSQNPDIKRLGEVLASTEGLTVLRATRLLTEAHTSTHPADQRLSESLIRTRHQIREASHNLRGFDGRDVTLFNIAEDILETAKAIHDSMKKKVENAEKDAT